MSIVIEVFGIAQPGGSKVAGITKKGRLFVRPDNPKSSSWRADVAKAAKKQYSGPLLDGPIEMTYEFRFPRPKRHFGTGKNSTVLKANAEHWHVTKPDLTKIIRSTEDALNGIVWTDDSKVCKRRELKRYVREDEEPGVRISIVGL
jgi:Holliday junction resolvase RusA-like endonuclease